jgi:hypothetical protein
MYGGEYKNMDVWGRVFYKDVWWIVVIYGGELKKYRMPEKKTYSDDFDEWVMGYDFSGLLREMGYVRKEYKWGREVNGRRVVSNNFDVWGKMSAKKKFGERDWRDAKDSFEEGVKEIGEEVLEKTRMEVLKWNEFVEKCLGSDQIFIAV